jgi:hypothetical protein
MSTKIRVDKIQTDADDWDDSEFDEDEFNKPKRRGLYNGKKRKEIEDVLEERRLKRQISYNYDYDLDMHV